MPWEALDQARDEIIYVYNFGPDPKKKLQGRRLLCPVCGEDMAVRSESDRAQAHFYHTLKGAQHDWPYSESRPHRAVKATLRAWLKQDPFWKHAKAVHQEAVIETKRRSDLMVVFPDGTRAAHEVQLQPLSRRTLEQRSLAYQKAGVPVFWWFRRGYLASKPFLRESLSRWQPFHLLIGLTMPPDPHAGERRGWRLRNRWPRKIELGVMLLPPAFKAQAYHRLNTELEVEAEYRRIIWVSVWWAALRLTLARSQGWPTYQALRRQLHPYDEGLENIQAQRKALQAHFDEIEYLSGQGEITRKVYLRELHYYHRQMKNLSLDDDQSDLDFNRARSLLADFSSLWRLTTPLEKKMLAQTLLNKGDYDNQRIVAWHWYPPFQRLFPQTD